MYIHSHTHVCMYVHTNIHTLATTTAFTHYTRTYVRTVHNTENLTFLSNSVVVPCRHPRIVVWYKADLPCRRTQMFHADEHDSSVQIQVENGGNQKRTSCTMMLMDREGHCKNCSIYHCSFWSSLGPLHNNLHGKFKTFNRLKRSKAGEITTNH